MTQQIQLLFRRPFIIGEHLDHEAIIESASSYTKTNIRALMQELRVLLLILMLASCVDNQDGRRDL